MATKDIGQETAIYLDNQPDKLRKGDKVFIKATSESLRAGAPKFEIWIVDSINRRSNWCNVRKEHESRPRCSRKLENGGKWWISQGTTEADELIEKMLNDLEEEGVSLSHTPDLSPEQNYGEVQGSSDEESDMDLEVPTQDNPGGDDAAIRGAYLRLQYTAPVINLHILEQDIEKNLQIDDRAFFRGAFTELMKIRLEMEQQINDVETDGLGVRSHVSQGLTSAGRIFEEMENSITIFMFNVNVSLQHFGYRDL